MGCKGGMMGASGVFPAGVMGKGMAPLNRKTQICNYWKENRCTRGSLCAFAHGEHELVNPAQARAQFMAQQAARTAPMAPPRPPLSSDPKFVINRKSQICLYWKEGRCTRGVNCSFAHGEDDLRKDSFSGRDINQDVKKRYEGTSTTTTGKST